MSKRTKYIILFLLGGKILFLFFFIFGFSYDNNATENSTRFVEIKNDINYEIEEFGTVKATWYGNEFHGQNTASGEIFNENELTAAHRSLPFGTMLQLTNTKNGKTVIVKINDRGPVSRSLELDLSKAAAEKLGFKSQGVAKLQVSEIVLENKSMNFIKNY